MILETSELLQIMKDNPAKNLLANARKQAGLMNAHITGQNFKETITYDEAFEDEQKKNLRQKYSRSNRDLFGRLHRPLDKVFRAKGGSIVYNMKGDTKEFAAYLNNIREGMSVKKWIQQVALTSFQIDPMGIIFMEVGTELDYNGRRQPYPTYKATSDIFDYKFNGRKLEYVVFKLTKDTAKNYIATGVDIPQTTQAVLQDRIKDLKDGANLYRVVDDTTDKIFEYSGGDDLTEMTALTLPNYFMEVPAMIISDIVSYNSDIFLSPDWLVVDLANDFLTDCSVFNIWKKLHGFPKQWRIRSVCSTCMGQTNLQGRVCPDCAGTGYRRKSTPRDEIVIPIPEESQKLPDKFFGFETPDIKGADMMTSELKRIEDLMFFTLYGTTPQHKTQGPATDGEKTATEVVHDIQSMIDKLDDFREWGQTLETFIIDSCGQLMYGTGYDGVSDNWGNRFVMEGPDVLWEKYKNARTAGAPQATLDGLLRDYYESRYATSPMDLAKSMMLMKVEPWIHQTIANVELMSVTDLDRAAKTYFSEWISTKQDMEIIMGKEDALRADLYAYVTPKAATVSAEALAEANLQPVKNLTERITV